MAPLVRFVICRYCVYLTSKICSSTCHHDDAHTGTTLNLIMKIKVAFICTLQKPFDLLPLSCGVRQSLLNPDASRESPCLFL